jgi:hypothetical protein
MGKETRGAYSGEAGSRILYKKFVDKLKYAF